MTHKNLTEFHINHDKQHDLEAVTTQDPSCPKCHPLERQSVKFKQFLSWYRNWQAIKTFSQWTVEIFDQYLTDLNHQRAEDGTLAKDQIKVLGERARFIVKSFRYSGRPNTRSVELGFYITKLAKATGFSSRCLHEATYQEQILEWEQEYAESQNKGRSYISNPFKHLPWDLRNWKDKGKEEAYLPSGDDFEEQVLFGYEGSTQESLSIWQRKFNFQDEIHHRETLGNDNPLIKELPEVIDVNQLREQLYRNQEDQPQLETEYQSGSEGGLTPPNEPQNNQPSLNFNFNQIDNNTAAVLAAALTGLQNVIAAPREGRVAQLPTFSGRADEDVREFIWYLEIAFQAN